MPTYSAQQQNEFYNNRRATMPVDAMAVLYDSQDRVLLVKPTYKQGWALPGGMSEAAESPLSALRREVREEIGLVVPTERFTLCGLRYVEARKGRNAYTQVLFCAHLTTEEIAGITLEAAELEAYHFVSLKDMSQYADAPRIQAVMAYLEAAQHGAVYIENEVAVGSG